MSAHAAEAPIQNTLAEPASGRAIAALVLGILGICMVLPLIGPIAAVLLGAGETSGPGRAGAILGWICLVLYGVVIVAGVAFLVLAAGVTAVAT